ncbi:MAG: hypothetical protein GXP63_07040 [DPANN group archaeon]|nr:hypothetical protein [DPANN group archaeon]
MGRDLSVFVNREFSALVDKAIAERNTHLSREDSSAETAPVVDLSDLLYQNIASRYSRDVAHDRFRKALPLVFDAIDAYVDISGAITAREVGVTLASYVSMSNKEYAANQLMRYLSGAHHLPFALTAFRGEIMEDRALQMIRIAALHDTTTHRTVLGMPYNNQVFCRRGNGKEDIDRASAYITGRFVREYTNPLRQMPMGPRQKVPQRPRRRMRIDLREDIDLREEIMDAEWKRNVPTGPVSGKGEDGQASLRPYALPREENRRWIAYYHSLFQNRKSSPATHDALIDREHSEGKTIDLAEEQNILRFFGLGEPQIRRILNNQHIQDLLSFGDGQGPYKIPTIVFAQQYLNPRFRSLLDAYLLEARTDS